MTSDTNPVTEAKVNLGRNLFYDTRLSKGRDVSCNSCHSLENYGVHGEVVSSGHKGQLGGRNSPSVYHAAGQIAQFWDSRAADVEEQAKGPVLNPVEMAIGGRMFQKLGLEIPWPVATDLGRMAVTKNAADRMVFKDPSLRNVERTR